VEIVGAGHYPQETAAEQLLPPLELFLAATEPFEYNDPTRATGFDEDAPPLISRADRAGVELDVAN
jgi:hypothetical protein